MTCKLNMEEEVDKTYEKGKNQYYGNMKQTTMTKKYSREIVSLAMKLEYEPGTQNNQRKEDNKDVQE